MRDEDLASIFRGIYDWPDPDGCSRNRLKWLCSGQRAKISIRIEQTAKETLADPGLSNGNPTSTEFVSL
jgi:hypothetical protein